jgi:hypothetical protein
MLSLRIHPQQVLDASQGDEGLQVCFLSQRERATPAVAGQERLTQRWKNGMTVELR